MLQATEPSPSHAISVDPDLIAASDLPAESTAGSCRVDAQAAQDDATGEDALVALIPVGTNSILHLGCGSGRLARLLRKRHPSYLAGVDADETRVKASRNDFDDVLLGDIERLPDFSPASFDVVVCSLLSQVRDPWTLLRRIRTWLEPGGRLVARVPNIRHHSAVRALLSGLWHDESAAATGPGNLRLFTRRELEKAFYRTGYQIRQIQGVPGPGYDRWHSEGRPGRVQTEGLAIDGLPQQDAEDFHSSHFLIEAEPSPSRSTPLTSIVILTYNQLAYTKQCVDSILRYTDEPIELIFVDNASTDGTVEYLRSIPNARLIANAENRGFPAGVNQGIQVASGAYILLLNNDCIVTTGWLHRLHQAIERDPSVGLVGPCSNNVSGTQKISAAYHDLVSLDAFAWDHGKANDRRYFDIDRLVGFCLLIKREVVKRIGLFDERFGIGCFEDDDYCRRAKQAGYRLLIVSDAFVHHFGSSTFLGSGVDLNRVLQDNQQRYREKWGDRRELPPESLLQREESALPVHWEIIPGHEPGLRLRPRTTLLSVCMIVRDNANTLEAALRSIKPWVDEMVVVDTGSKDATPEIAHRCGARVFHFPWCDDFSAARNESLRHATGQWLFWMDSDDTIDTDNGHKLRQLALSASDPSILGYVMQVHCPGGGESGDTDVTVVDHVKLIRNRPDLRFEHRIHEQILPAIRRAGGEVAFTDIFVVHSGADHTPEGRQRKLRRDFHLLELDLQERPDHPFVLFNLGMTYADAGEHEKAVDALQRAVAVAHPNESHVRKAYALWIGSLMQLGRHKEAWQACQEGRGHYPDDTELLFREGVLHHHFGRLNEAKEAYLAILSHRDPRHFASIDRGIAGFKTRHNLALVYEELGELGLAERQWRQVVADMPTYRTGWHALGELLIRQRNLDAAEQLGRRLVEDSDVREPICQEGRLLLGRVAAVRGDLVRARSLFQQALERSPNDVRTLHALCRFLFEYGDPTEAEEPLTKLTNLEPSDGATYHNLGIVWMRRGRIGDAIEAFQESLQHRPDSTSTRLLLAQALQTAGQNDNAINIRCAGAP